MTITTVINEGTVTLVLDGWLDTLSAQELGTRINSVDAASKIVLDFDKVEYMSSSGLRQVIACHRKAKEIGAGFEVINVGKEVASVFSLTGLDRKMTVIGK